jgi:hypothetical protein
VANDWRVTVTLPEESHAGLVATTLRDHEVEADLHRQLGDRVAVSVDDSRLFLYAGAEAAAQAAEQVLRGVLTRHSLDQGTVTLDHWHPDEEKWESASVALPQTEEQRQAEHERLEQEEKRESLETGYALWEVRVELPSHREAVELARRMQSEGRRVIRRWTLLVLGANDQDDASALAAAITKEAPADATVSIAEQGPLKAFLPIGPIGIWG